jgi:hypothetical protein
MSDNPMNLKVLFENEAKAMEVETILNEAKQWMNENSSEERWLSDYISENEIGEGINFDSSLYPNVIDNKGSFLMLEFVGSPGEDLSGDIVAWLKKKGAKSIKGTLLISGVGEEIEIDY